MSGDVKAAVEEAFGEFLEKVKSNPTAFGAITTPDALAKGGHDATPKAWFSDPYQLLESMGLGYQHSPSPLTYETLRSLSERDTVVASIIGTRVNQVAAFARPQPNKYSVGFKVKPIGADKHRRLTASEKDRARRVEFFLRNTGIDHNLDRDSFNTFLRKIVRDRLTYDQMCFEKTRSYSKRLHSIHAVDAATMRLARPKSQENTPLDVAQIKRTIKFVQVIQGQIPKNGEFTHDEMAFLVANPRTNIKVHGYGFSEGEQLVTTVTSHLWAEEWNRRAFSQGSTTKGVLNLKGSIPPNQFEAIKRQWLAQVGGISNAWKTPMVNTEGVEWIPLQMNNTEMGYQMWMEYLIKIACAIYQIDPAEINFDLRGGAAAAPMFMSTNEAQQKVSKDKGLQPLLDHVEDGLNRHVVSQIDPEYEMVFIGLDAKTEEQTIELRLKQAQNLLTLNEARALEDYPPLKDGDVVLNPNYTGYVRDKMMQQQQGGPPGAGGPPGGDGGDVAGGAGGNPAQPSGSAPGAGGPQQPYQGKFQQAPDEVEHHGAEQLRQFHEQDDDSSPMRRSLPAPELLVKASEADFDLIDLE